jgi:TldD protein
MRDLLDHATEYCNRLNVDYFEIRLSKLLRNIVQVRNDSVSILQPSSSSNASVRVLDGNWGFSYFNDLTKENFKQAADQATKLARNSFSLRSEKTNIYEAPIVNYSNLAQLPNDPREGSIEELKEIFLEAAKVGQEVDERINLMLFHCENDVELNYYMNSEGTSIEYFLPRTFMVVYAIAKEGGKVKRKRNRMIVSAGSEVLLYSDPITFGQNVAREAISTLEAKSHPKGKMPVVIDNFLAGTFGSLFGLQLKASNILGSTDEENFFRDNLHQQIASEIISITNEPNMEGMPVSYQYDVEGVKARPRKLIEDGILKGYLHDRTTAKIMGVEPMGSTRAVDAAHPPTAELSNVIIKSGKHSLPELIEDIPQGIYATGLAGASTSGYKTLMTSESGFLIENGELTQPLDQISMGFDIRNELNQVDAVGKDFSPASIRNYAGAYYALIGSGSPHLRFKALEVK